MYWKVILNFFIVFNVVNVHCNVFSDSDVHLSDSLNLISSDPEVLINKKIVPKDRKSVRPKRTTASICIEIRPNNPYEEPYYMCKGSNFKNSVKDIQTERPATYNSKFHKYAGPLKKPNTNSYFVPPSKSIQKNGRPNYIDSSNENHYGHQRYKENLPVSPYDNNGYNNRIPANSRFRQNPKSNIKAYRSSVPEDLAYEQNNGNINVQAQGNKHDLDNHNYVAPNQKFAHRNDLENVAEEAHQNGCNPRQTLEHKIARLRERSHELSRQ